jgi:zinc-ribbon domain
MAARVSIECPGCSARLNLADASKLGKKIKCPKCAEVFVAKAADDADDDFDDEEEAPAKPAANRKRPAAGGKKSGVKKGGAPSGGGSNVPLIAGGAVAVLLLIGAGLYFSGLLGGSKPTPAPPVVNNPPPVAPPAAPPPVVVPEITPTEKALALRWMPNETETLLHVKVADLWQAPLLKGLLDTPQAAEAIKQMQEKAGISPTDIESITVGVADMQGMQAMGMSAAMGMPVQVSPPKALTVVRTKKSLSLDDVLKTGSEHIQPAEYKGKKYFESKKNTDPSGWFADSQTLVVGMPTELKAAMDRGETVIPRKEFSMMQAAPQVILVFAPKDPKAMSQGAELPPLPGIPPEMQEILKAVKDSSTGFGLGLSIRGGFDLQTAFAFTNPEGAKKVKENFDKVVVGGRAQFEQYKAKAQPLLAELGDLLLNNLKVEEQNQIVKISTSIPDSEQAKLEQLPPLFAVMAMTGGFGAGGPPGFGPPDGAPAMTPGGLPFPSPGGFPGGPPATPGAFPPGFNPGGIGDGKMPGETDAVEAEKAEGLPEGVALSVKSSWSEFPLFGSDGKASHPIQIMLDVKGEGIGGICGYGQITTKSMSIAEGGVLKMAKSTMFGVPDPAKSIVPYDSADPLNFDHPEGALRIVFSVDPPTGAATAITSLEGTFKYLTSEESEEFTIDDAPKTALRPLSDPKLKAAGVKLLYAKPSGVGRESLTLVCGKTAFLGKAGATNPGDPNANGVTVYFNPEVEKNQFVQRLHPFDQSGKFPEKLQVKFKLFSNIKEHTVSFKFANVPLPRPDSMPKPAVPGQPPAN